VCNENAPEKFLSRLASCGWLQIVVDAITAGATVAQCMHCCKGGAGGNGGIGVVSGE